MGRRRRTCDPKHLLRVLGQSSRSVVTGSSGALTRPTSGGSGIRDVCNLVRRLLAADLALDGP